MREQSEMLAGKTEYARNLRAAFLNALPLLLVTATALLLRFHALRWGLPDSRHFFSYHPDEFYMVGGVIGLATDSNPHFFNYGTLFIHLMALANLVGSFFLPPSGESAWVSQCILSGRVVSALLGTATVMIVYLIADRAAGRKAAITAALLLVFWPAHLVHSHFATVDVAAAFMAALTLMLCLRLYEGEDRWLLWAAAAAGLTAATRYNAGMVLLALPSALLLRPGGSWQQALRRLPAVLAMAAVGFLAGCPYPLLAPAEFAPAAKHAQRLMSEGLGDLFYDTAPAWVYHFRYNFLYGSGLPSLLLLLPALLASFRRRRMLLIVAWAICFYLAIAFAQVKFMRYLIPILPMAAVAIGVMLAQMMEARRAGPRLAGYLLSGILLLYTGAYGLSFAALMGGPDPRDVLADSMRNLPVGASVAVTHVPNFSTPPLIWYNGGMMNPAMFDKALRESSFRLDIVDFKPAVLRNLSSDYLLLSEYDYREVARQNPGEFTQSQRAIDEGYDLIRSVAVSPGLGPIKFAKGFPPHDLLYVYPEVRLYGRKR